MLVNSEDRRHVLGIVAAPVAKICYLEFIYIRIEQNFGTGSNTVIGEDADVVVAASTKYIAVYCDLPCGHGCSCLCRWQSK